QLDLFMPNTECKGLGSPAGSRGYACRGSRFDGQGGPRRCKILVIKENVVKGICGATHMFTLPPYVGNAAINVWTIGMGGRKRYCAKFEQPFAENDGKLKAFDAAAP